jgi:hypothetical protein
MLDRTRPLPFERLPTRRNTATKMAFLFAPSAAARGTRPVDPLVFLLATLTSTSFALVECRLAARRASMVDRMETLRCE